MIPQQNPPKVPAGTITDVTSLAAFLYATQVQPLTTTTAYWAIVGMVLVSIIRLIPVLVEAYVKITQTQTQKRQALIQEQYALMEIQKKQNETAN